MSSYASPSDLIARHSVQLIGQLASDTSAALTPAQVLTDPVVAACLGDAAGEIDSALLRGQRYTVDDLAALTDNSRALLKRINCDGAFVWLWNRKGWGGDDQRVTQSQENFERMLSKLGNGESVFNVTKVLQAGVPEITGPSTVLYNQLNTIAGRCRGHMYPNIVMPFNR
jgi:phage gp36-like protein